MPIREIAGLMHKGTPFVPPVQAHIVESQSSGKEATRSKKEVKESWK
jgi:hypothetical protein